jgi:hypothetical protein
MTASVTYCGDATPGHASRRCKECRRIVQATYRAKAKGEPVGLPESLMGWLETAAVEFDDISGEDRFTAAEFVAWLRPEIVKKAAA